MTCQIVKDTVERVKQGGMGKEGFAFNGDRWKVLMSDTPSSITHSKFGVDFMAIWRRVPMQGPRTGMDCVKEW